MAQVLALALALVCLQEHLLNSLILNPFYKNQNP
jgi:hypothetical protein